MKKYTVIILITAGIVLGFLTGIYLYKINQIDDDTEVEKIAELVEDECTQIAYLEDSGMLDLVRTNSEDKKTSPNCKLILKLYYKKCEHLIEKRENIKENEVNLTEQELKEKFPEWEIQRFTPTEIVLYKEVNETCNEHYMLKEKDGYIALYQLDEINEENLIEITDIPTEYLAKEDLEKIQNGIIIYTKKELNKVIEDFE